MRFGDLKRLQVLSVTICQENLDNRVGLSSSEIPPEAAKFCPCVPREPFRGRPQPESYCHTAHVALQAVVNCVKIEMTLGRRPTVA